MQSRRVLTLLSQVCSGANGAFFSGEAQHERTNGRWIRKGFVCIFFFCMLTTTNGLRSWPDQCRFLDRTVHNRMHLHDDVRVAIVRFVPILVNVLFGKPSDSVAVLSFHLNDRRTIVLADQRHRREFGSKVVSLVIF